MDLSIVIPSLNEGYHLRTLTEKIRAVLAPFSIEYEVWIIDDSTDNTLALIEKITQDFPNVHAIHRNEIGGQNSAIIEGIRRSIGEHLIIMDGTLRHPPELFIDIYHALITEADIVIPSHFMKKNLKHLSLREKFHYWLNTRTSKKYLPKLNPLTNCTTNYFGLKKSVIENVTLTPVNPKILLEILMKGNFKTAREIPYPATLPTKSAARKVSFKQKWHYLKQIKNLILLK